MMNTLPINKLYKTLALVALVVAPIYWLMFTTDGKRRTDTLVLWLMGDEPIDLNLQSLNRNFTRADWQTVYPDLPWQCSEQSSAFGDSICFTDIGSYNGIPAHYLTVYFQHDSTNALKLVYRDQYHDKVGEDIQTQLGPAGSTVSQALPIENDVLQWQTGNGLVLLKRQLLRGEDASLLWLSQQAQGNQPEN